MNIRTCPHCNYKYSVPEYLSEVLFKFVFLEWNCKNCNKKISFDFKRRVILALAFAVLYVILFALKDTINMTPLRWAVLLTLYIIGSIFIFTFDTFKKVK